MIVKENGYGIPGRGSRHGFHTIDINPDESVALATRMPEPAEYGSFPPRIDATT